jgi:serine phosphatase RsbU (regulator of sigma subunit)
MAPAGTRLARGNCVDRAHGDELKRLTRELNNFEEMARCLRPQPEDLPRLSGIDIYGGTLALGGAVGGDHIIYLDFTRRFDLQGRIRRATADGRFEVADNLRRCQTTAGIAVIDVSGHQVTDALPAAMLHQALLLGAVYELDISGQITKRLFENLNARFHNSSGDHKFVSFIYGEISEDAMFRFLSAAQPFPLVFSAAHDRFMDVAPELCVSFPPLGLLPSLDVVDRSPSYSRLGFKDHYQMNEWVLMGAGDILLLYTDGLAEHSRGAAPYFPDRLEQKLREVKGASAPEIFSAIEADVRAFGEPADDLSLVVVKRL